MEKVDKRFSELFLVPPGVLRSPSMTSQPPEKEDGLQRRTSIKKRILGVFQSSKSGWESSPDPPRTLKRKGKQKVERIVTAERVKEEIMEENRQGRPASSARPLSPKSCPPVSMDRYPRLRRLTLQDEIVPLPRPTPRSVPEPTRRTKSLTSYQTATSNFISPPRNPSPVLTRRFSFQSSSRDPSPAPTTTTTSTPTFPLQVQVNQPRDKSPTPSTKSFSSFTRRLSLRRRNLSSEDSNSITIVRPVIVYPPHVMGNLGTFLSRKHKKDKSEGSSGRDSKYSSVSSLPGIMSAEEASPRASAVPSPTLPNQAILSATQFRQIESSIRRIGRTLQHHQFHCDQLSANLQFLCKTKWSNMDRVETYLFNKKANRSHIQQMRSSISKARANVGTVFKKKSTLSKRSLDALDDAKAELKVAKNAADGEDYNVNWEVIRKFTGSFLLVLEQQRKLDQEMEETLTVMKANPAFHMNKGDWREIRAFATFIGGRLAQQELCYTKIEASLKRITTAED